MKKRIVLFVPLVITIAVLDIVALAMALYEQNLALGITVLLMLLASAVKTSPEKLPPVMVP